MQGKSMIQKKPKILSQRRRPEQAEPQSRSAKAPVREESDLVIGLHTLRVPRGAHKRKKLLGRGSGSGHGKTSSRGSKGQTSRSGPDYYLGFEGGQTPLIRRIPKRGFVGKGAEYQLVNISTLDKLKTENATLEVLEEKGIIKNKSKLVKILGEGKLTHPISVQAHAFSKQAALKIKDAGGKTEFIHD